MALEQDEMRLRKEKREQQHKKQHQDSIRLRFAIALAILILLAVGVVIYRLASTASERAAEAEAEAAANAAETTAATVPETTSSYNPITTIHLRAAGDLNITDSVVNSGLVASGFDYSRAFLDVSAELAAGDITVLNFEGNVCNQEYGTETTNAPPSILTALRNAGVDFLQMANSCSLNNGLIGLSTTLNNIRQAGMEPLGAYASSADFKSSKGYTICEVKGIKIAIVAFTKGIGGMGMPAGNEDCVNLLYTDYDSTYKTLDKTAITSVLKSAQEEDPDITIAMLHWGSENNDEISTTQTSLISLLQKNGVDIIIGTHPHLVQQIDYDEDEGTLIAYSLGDFYGDAVHSGTNYSIILDIEITHDDTTDTTRVSGFSYIPIYTVTESETVDGFRRVVRIDPGMYAYENNFVDKYTASTYAQMTYSLQRIEARVNGTG